jgi:hypothetical protein
MTILEILSDLSVERSSNLAFCDQRKSRLTGTF